MKRSLLLALIIVLALFAAGCVNTPTATPTPTPVPTAAATPTPLATAADNIVVTLTPGTSSPIITITHFINGTILFNKQPTSGYHVIVDTDKGHEFGNVTNADGSFSIQFPDDGSATYYLKLADNGNNIIYQDNLPRYLNHTGPLSINVEVPGTNQINVSVT